MRDTSPNPRPVKVIRTLPIDRCARNRLSRFLIIRMARTFGYWTRLVPSPPFKHRLLLCPSPRLHTPTERACVFIVFFHSFIILINGERVASGLVWLVGWARMENVWCEVCLLWLLAKWSQKRYRGRRYGTWHPPRTWRWRKASYRPIIGDVS